MQVRVFDCPSCGAPLPAAADGTNVTCAHCSVVTVIESGGAAELKAREARAAAEALFATLGQPPSLFQRIAVVLASPWVWGLGFPFAFAALVRVTTIPMQLITASWERSHHERLLHVVSPPVAWVLEVGGVMLGALVLLVASLLGQRVDSRRELQATLAAKPPATPGGKAACRNCNAPLEVAAGALGERCTSCGADNLVMLPESWVTRAESLTKTLRVSAQLASEKDAEGRKRVRGAAMWRVPMVLGLLAIVSWPAFNRRERAGWSDLRIQPGGDVGVYKLMKHAEHGDPTRELMGLAHCELLAGKHPVRIDASGWCGKSQCVMIAMLSLSAGETLRLDFVQPGEGVEARLSVAPQDYLGGTGVFADSFGEVVKRAAVSTDGFEAPVEISGWYKLTVSGPADASVQPCVVAN